MNKSSGDDTEIRKIQHIDICLHDQVVAEGVTTGFEHVRFIHNALPEMNFADIDLKTTFCGKQLQVPFMVSSMTGGTARAAEINRTLAITAERRGWAMGVGSMRAAIENPALTYTFDVRRYAPNTAIFANIGAVQLNYGYGLKECRHIVETIGADGLLLHLNALQEAIQPEGTTNFRDLLVQLEKICAKLSVPVGVKEVGWGISARTARQLLDAGVAFIDVAGAGGTSWSQVEKHRLQDPVRQRAAATFAGWGIPTAESIRDVRLALPNAQIIGSGGMKSGLDAAKAIALGADLVGFGRSLLQSAVDSAELLNDLFEQLELELRLAMFGVGVDQLKRLQDHSLLQSI